MKYTTLIALALVITGTLQAQRLFFNVAGGMMNYGGDLQNQSFTFNQANSALSAGASYKLMNNFFISASITGGKLAASDAKTNQERYRRNLSFYTNVTEGSLRLDAQLKDVPGTFKFTPYVFAGVALFHFNPYTYYQGEKIYLKPLRTEGEGLPEYPNRKPYKLTQFAIPFGGGLSYAISNSIMVSAEVGFRKLFTDYLDDASSKTYADTAILRSKVGDLSAKLSFRGDEVTSNPLQFNTKLQRGNPDRKDVYYTCLIKFSFSLDNLGSSGGWYSKKARKQCGCPGKVL